MSDEMYTLDEARREIGRQECLSSGHYYEQTEVGWPPKLIRIDCPRCGSTWSVTQTRDGLADN